MQGRWNVEAQTLVKAFKQQCVDEGQLDVALLKITVELTGLTVVSNKFPKYEGVLTHRLSDGALLDDDTSVTPAESHVLVSQAPAILAGWLQVHRHTSPSGIRKIPRTGVPSSSMLRAAPRTGAISSRMLHTTPK